MTTSKRLSSGSDSVVGATTPATARRPPFVLGFTAPSTLALPRQQLHISTAPLSPPPFRLGFHTGP